MYHIYFTLFDKKITIFTFPKFCLLFLNNLTVYVRFQNCFTKKYIEKL